MYKEKIRAENQEKQLSAGGKHYKVLAAFQIGWVGKDGRMAATSENTRIGVKLKFEPEGNDRLSIFALAVYMQYKRNHS